MRSWLVAFGVGLAGSACLVEPEHVLACGDGFVDVIVGEECDPNDPRSFEGACLETSRPLGTAACHPDSCEIIDTPEQCALCGDGIIDFAAGEECDPAAAAGGLVAAYPCAALQAPDERKPYASGTAVLCLDTCRYDRSSCGYCGDGAQDPAVPHAFGSNSESDPELCDGDDFDLPALADTDPTCAEPGAQPIVTCDADCRGVSPPDSPLCR